MKISGIITEYNPFHNGHIYHLNQTKEITKADAVICIMSGNFVQRGTPAIIDKWNRTKMALLNGVDLVIELPVTYSLSSAEFFSYGAVSLLHNLGIVDSICFGSECGDIEVLNIIAKVLVQEPYEYKLLLQTYLNNGESFPKARSNALEDYLTKYCNDINHKEIDLKSLLNSSNNILGIEYCKSLLSLNSPIVPYSLKREGANYKEKNLKAAFSSATSIRKFIKENENLNELNNHIPKASAEIINELKNSNYSFVFPESMFDYLKYKAFTNSYGLKNIPDVCEGLDNKIINALKNSYSFDDAVENIKSKRYTYTRIYRILCQYFIGFENYNISLMRKSLCPYARILGFNSKGKIMLNKMKETSSIPIYPKVNKSLKDSFSLDLTATYAYSLINNSIDYDFDFKRPPIILK